MDSWETLAENQFYEYYKVGVVLYVFERALLVVVLFGLEERLVQINYSTKRKLSRKPR
jgi:hypothetical protein